MPHGAYVEITEYSKDGYLPISEIASGWIKNIHEFIREGQRDVAKIIAVDSEKGSIDVSLKKATSKEKADKMTEQGLEKRYEKLFEQAAKLAGINDKKEIDALRQEIAKKVPTYTDLINNSAQDTKFTAFLKNKQFSTALNEIIQKNIKPKRYFVQYTMELRSNDPRSGIGPLRTALGSIEECGVDVLYLGAPKYQLTAEGDSYLTAEGKINESRKILDSYAGKIAFSMKAEKHD